MERLNCCTVFFQAYNAFNNFIFLMLSTINFFNAFNDVIFCLDQIPLENALPDSTLSSSKANIALDFIFLTIFELKYTLTCTATFVDNCHINFPSIDMSNLSKIT